MIFSENDPDRLLASSAERAAWSGEDLAKVLGAFRTELRAQGFPDDELREFCMEFFLAMLDPRGGEDE